MFYISMGRTTIELIMCARRRLLLLAVAAGESMTAVAIIGSQCSPLPRNQAVMLTMRRMLMVMMTMTTTKLLLLLYIVALRGFFRFSFVFVVKLSFCLFSPPIECMNNMHVYLDILAHEMCHSLVPFVYFCTDAMHPTIHNDNSTVPSITYFFIRRLCCF